MFNLKEIKFISVLHDIIIVTKDFIRELETIAKRDMRRHPWRQDSAGQGRGLYTAGKLLVTPEKRIRIPET